MIAILIAALVAEPTVILKPKMWGHHTQLGDAYGVPVSLLSVAAHDGPSLIDRAARATRRLYEKTEPRVAQGNARAAQGDVEGALQEYGKAEVPEHGPQAGAFAHDKASALLRAGNAQLAPRAIEEANRALTEADSDLKPQAAYDLGYALEQSGRSDDAIAAYARALQLDPQDRDSKVNLELLLREEQRNQKQPQPAGQQEKDKKQQANKDAAQKQQSEQQQKQQQNQQKQSGKDQQQKQQQGDPKNGDQQQSGQAPQEPKPDKTGEKKDLQASGARPMDRSEAQRLLDALRAGEKNLQVWRFGKEKAKERRHDVEKDW
jgi:tetratricopeptide (TPR) repeat protein